MAGELKKFTATVAQEVYLRYALEVEPEEEPLLDDKIAPANFLDGLIQAGAFAHAAKFLAFGLPKREAAWWACLVAREVLPEDAPAEAQAALKAAETWVYKPTEENRRAVMEKGEAADDGSPAAWAAFAAGWSGGSLAPADMEVVPPPEDLTGKAVKSAITLAVYGTEPERAAEKIQLFVAQGMDVAKGGNGRVTAAGERLSAPAGGAPG
jgi:hypothetical protein